MKTFVAHLVKTTSHIPFRCKSKRVEFQASDSVEAVKKINEDFQGWSVSMFWPVYKK